MRAIGLVAVMVLLAASAGARADGHYVSLADIFTRGKCAAVSPNFELMMARFAGGEITEHKIHDNEGDVIEVITTFINKNRDQWATVGSRRDEKVIFCLYASGTGQGSIERRTIR